MSDNNSLNSPLVLNALLKLAEKAEPPFAHWLLKQADRLRGSVVPLSKEQRKMIDNLKVVFGDNMTEKQYKATALKCFYLRSQALYDFFHFVKDKQSLRDRIHLTDGARAMIDYLHTKKSGAVAVSPHFVGADIVGMELGQHVKNAQALSFPNPTRSYKNENLIRAAYGVRVTPASTRAMQTAMQTLRDGGLVAGSTDRAHPEEEYTVSFFGKPAHLPTVYIRLAIRLQVPVFHFTGVMSDDYQYSLDATEPIFPEAYPDRQDEVVNNLRNVLVHTEKAIRKHPEQWCMFHPVWQNHITTKEKENS
jgi:lauroyl/myristoyl acyltransferase